jgi:hypothetical protein
MIKLIAFYISIAALPFQEQKAAAPGNSGTTVHLWFSKSSPANIFLPAKKEKQPVIFSGCYRPKSMRAYIK